MKPMVLLIISTIYIQVSKLWLFVNVGLVHCHLYDVHGPGWRAVPTYDPVVQDAAHHAVKSIQQRSNSLSPYELLQILLAKAEVSEDSTKFAMLLKVRRGTKEEKFKVIINKSMEGKFYLNQMEDHS
ncbi:cystatin B [Actinidia rufa]|uniref:Cystatin B n=1 Tax=Actinidia rufa TaxID=165716 RepID=A0A7J0EG84_9ERIC|nr:cystatin B [Actinidia rufa]